MHQIFVKLSETEQTPDRFKAFRQKLAALELDGFIIPRTDEYQNEYVPACAERLRWLTGFSGSAGLAVVLKKKKAAIFIDGRYVLQVQNEIDPALLTPLQIPEHSPAKWLAEQAGDKARIGFDPRLHSIKQIEQWQQTLQDAGKQITLAPVVKNPVDCIWRDRPEPPLTPVQLHPKKYAGKSAADKIAALQAKLVEDELSAFLLTSPSSICWLFNIRGRDVPHTPLVLSYAIVPAKGQAELIVDPQKLDEKVGDKLRQVALLQPMDKLAQRIKQLKRDGGRIGLDPHTTSFWFGERLAGKSCEPVHEKDPCTLPKAIKNSAEIRGMRQAHIRDGVAVTRFLCWLDHTNGDGIDEIIAAQKLEELREQTGQLQDISFETISGAGANGAIVHYRVDEDSNRKLRQNSLYLVDSGGQYKDGTTDITRTIAIGAPSEAMRRHYTLVLKGHVALAAARFPQGTRGVDLDVLARHALWQAGLDYDHGTGHGVGAYLGVHEGPQSISKKGMAPLESGMIISNEPGYYKSGAYGIRIENLVLVTPAKKPLQGERSMLGFDTLTMAPLDHNLIDVERLETTEIQWIDDYHRCVFEHIAPLLDNEDELAWLRNAIRPLKAS